MPLTFPILTKSGEPSATLAWDAASSPAASDPAAREFERLVTPYLPDMVRASEAILGSEDLAWDAVQETLMRLWGNGWLPERPRAALVHLAVKSSLHQLRCQRRRSDHESRRSAASSDLCCEEDPLARLEDAEQRRLVRAAVKGLAQEYRAVLEMFAFDGASYEAIANRLGVPVGTVRSRLSRGRALLRERLQTSIDAA